MSNPESALRSRRSWTYPKNEEKNFVGAIFHLLSLLLIFTSLIHLNWFRIWGGHCTPSLSTKQFFGLGQFYATRPTPPQYHFRNGGGIAASPSSYIGVIHYNNAAGSFACVTPDIVNLMHMLIILSVLAMISASIGFGLDTTGPTKHTLKVLRRNAVPGITTVFIVITIIGTSYFVTKSFEESLYDMHIPSDMQITYDYGCYVITAAGSFSILATTCNLLQTQSVPDNVHRHTRLVEDWDGMETLSVGMHNMPCAPPPYTP